MTIRHSDSFRLAAGHLYDDMGAQALECLDMHRSVAAQAQDFRRAHYAGILALFVTLVAAQQCRTSNQRRFNYPWQRPEPSAEEASVSC